MFSASSVSYAPRVRAPARLTHELLPDALRAFAIFIVVLSHVVAFARLNVGAHVVYVAYLGVWGVNAFFVLSGFLLGDAYVRAIYEDRALPDPKRFLARRFLRIYPLYFAAVVASALLVGALLRPISVAVLLRNVFMLQGTTRDNFYDLNAPLWTMGIDAVFYLALPFVMAAVASMARDRDRRSKTIVLAATLLTLSGVALAYRAVVSYVHGDLAIDFPGSIVYVRNGIGMIPTFAVGIGIAMLRYLRPTPAAGSRLAPLSVVVGLAIAVVEYLSTRAPVVSLPVSTMRESLLDPVAAISVGCILFGGLRSPTRHIASEAAAFLTGAASLAYAVYLIHYPILEVIEVRSLHDASGVIALVTLGLACFVYVLPPAIAGHVLIERQFLKMKDRLRESVS